MVVKLNADGFTKLYQSKILNSFENVLEFDDSEFNETYGDSLIVNLFIQKNNQVKETQTSNSEYNKEIFFKKFARKQLDKKSINHDGNFEKIGQEIIKSLESSIHSTERSEERSQRVLSLIFDINNPQTLKLGVNGSYEAGDESAGKDLDEIVDLVSDEFDAQFENQFAGEPVESLPVKLVKDKRVKIKNYYIVTSQGVYVLSSNKETIITTWQTNESFNEQFKSAKGKINRINEKDKIKKIKEIKEKDKIKEIKDIKKINEINKRK